MSGIEELKGRWKTLERLLPEAEGRGEFPKLLSRYEAAFDLWVWALQDKYSERWEDEFYEATGKGAI